MPEHTFPWSCNVPHAPNCCRPEHRKTTNCCRLIEKRMKDKFGQMPRDQSALWTVTTMSTRHDGRKRERSWERDDRDRNREKDRYSRGRAGGQRDGGRRRDSRSRSPKRGRSQCFERHIKQLTPPTQIGEIMTGIIGIEITRARAKMTTTGTAAETTSGLKDVMTGVTTGASLQLEIRIKEIRI